MSWLSTGHFRIAQPASTCPGSSRTHWPLSSGPQSHLGRSHAPGNKATAQAHWPPQGRGHSTCKGTEAWRRAGGIPRSLSAWWGRGGRCSAAPPVSSLHSRVIHTWPGQWPPARLLPMPCLCLCPPTSKLRSALESRLLQARPISSMGGGEESSRGRHRVPEGVAAASGQRLPVLRACGPKKFPLSPLAAAPPSMPSLAVQAEFS